MRTARRRRARDRARWGQSGQFGVSLDNARVGKAVFRQRFADRRSAGNSISPDASARCRGSFAEHSMPCRSTPRSAASDLDAVRQLRADLRERRLEPDARVRRAADDLGFSPPAALRERAACLRSDASRSRRSRRRRRRRAQRQPLRRLRPRGRHRPGDARASRSAPMSTRERSQFFGLHRFVFPFVVIPAKARSSLCLASKSWVPACRDGNYANCLRNEDRSRRTAANRSRHNAASRSADAHAERKPGVALRIDLARARRSGAPCRRRALRATSWCRPREPSGCRLRRQARRTGNATCLSTSAWAAAPRSRTTSLS